MHSTNDLEDGYLGSGKQLWHSIRKYGKENHKREILEYFSDRESLRKREEEIITEDFIKDKMCMNLCLGLGWTKETSIKGHERQRWLRENDSKWVEHKRKVQSLSMKKQYEDGIRERKFHYSRIGKKTSKETKEKLSQSLKGKNAGEKNGCFGTKWIYNEDLKILKQCKIEELEKYLAIDGWKLGFRKGLIK